MQKWGSIISGNSNCPLIEVTGTWAAQDAYGRPSSREVDLVLGLAGRQVIKAPAPA